MPSIKSPWWKANTTYGCTTTENMPKETILNVSLTEGVKKNTYNEINRTAGYSNLTAEDTNTHK